VKLAVLVALLVLIAGASIVLNRRFAPVASTAAPATSPAASEAILGVNDLMKNVDRHKREVRVQGVVSAVAAQSQSLALIDSREAKECGVEGGCAELLLPVHWAGAMPKVGQSVQLSGSVQESGGKLLFAAKALAVTTSQPAEAR
jgi:hypothetical protein